MRAQIKAKREERARLHEQATAHIKVINDDKADATAKAEARQAFDKANDKIDELGSDIKRMEDHCSAEEHAAASLESEAAANGRTLSDTEAREDVRRQAFRTYLINPNGMTDAQRDALRLGQEGLPNAAQTTTTDAGGGITVPTTVRAAVESAMKAYGGVRTRATILTTATGSTINMPTDNDVANEGEWLDENAEATEQDVVFGNVPIAAHILSSKAIRIPIALIQDSAINIESHIGAKLGERLARGSSRGYATGNNTGKPHGIVTACPKGADAAAAAVAYSDLLNLKHSIDPAYRSNAAWGFNDTTLKAMKSWVDSEGRPLWKPGIAVGDPDTIDGDPFVVIQEMANVGADNRSIIYGDFSKYMIRDVASMLLFRLTELFAMRMQIGMVGFWRTDGALLDAGAGPVKHLLHASE